MRKYLDDFFIVLGVSLIVSGVYAQFGIGYSLIVAGTSAIIVAYLLAKSRNTEGN